MVVEKLQVFHGEKLCSRIAALPVNAVNLGFDRLAKRLE